MTLSKSQNIAAINVGSTEHSQILANGNLGGINLIQDILYSWFTDHLDISAVATPPDMQVFPERAQRGSARYVVGSDHSVASVCVTSDAFLVYLGWIG